MRKGNVMSMHVRCFRFARSMRCSIDDAHDIATRAIIAGIEHDNLQWKYLAVATKNFLRSDIRNRRTRNEDYQMVEGEDGEYVEMRGYGQPASQEHRLFVNEVVSAIEELPEYSREVMRLTALDYTAPEIAELLHQPLADVQAKQKYGRKLLRQKEGYGIVGKRGHARFVGIRRKHRIWQATIVVKGQHIHLGNFPTAAAAALAYDSKAKELGMLGNLNFPGASS